MCQEALWYKAMVTFPTALEVKNVSDMPEIQPAPALDAIAQRIFEIRGQRVMLDSDLAVLYGVETKNLIKAVNRNPEKFEDFFFQLSHEEWDSLRFQIGTLKSGRGQHRKYLPYAFTEHGALMLSSVLNSPRATEVSRMIIRAFVWMRQTVPAYKELAAKVAELEEAVGKHDVTIGKHDAAIGGIIEALNELILPPDKDKRRIGF
ncbi:MAG: ORF6N domain-containing protein [Desulfovibrionaceae bacterium]|nr:ORF6N domain-containing protein [Desulfovibrionaceae bacterium]